MHLDTNYIDSTIGSIERTNFLTKRIHVESGSYVNLRASMQFKRAYLNVYELNHFLKKNGYSDFNIKKLVPYIRESIQYAYERGVFIVSSRVISAVSHKGKAIEVNSPKALLAHFREQENEAFTPDKWYLENTYTKDLYNKGYDFHIANELGPFILRHVRAAFSVGMKTAATKCVKS